MGKVAFVFSGQGAQYSGMGYDLYLNSPAARRIFDLADSIRPGTSRQCFEGTEEELSETINTQPCLYCVDLASAYALCEAGMEPDMVAGFSLGEMAALAFSEAIDFEKGFELVCSRGELMHESSKQYESVMAAVLKLDNTLVEAICARRENVYPVNYNCPGQLVVACLKAELPQLKDDIKAAGGKFILLPVSGGFHSPFMRSAAEKLGKLLEKTELSYPKVPLYSNYEAKPYSREGIANMLVKQMQNPVRWHETIENMIADGADTFIEVGAGKVLCGLISKISEKVRVYNVEDMESLRSTLGEVCRIA